MNSAKISKPTTPVKSKPEHHSETTSELLFGESVQVLKKSDQWCSVISVHDDYPGFVETAACDFSNQPTTHWVNNQATFVFEKPDIKSSIRQRLLFGSKLTVSNGIDHSNFLKLADHGFIWTAHVSDKATQLKSGMIEIAENHYLNAPYRWGGRSTDGCDCSGLVQMIAMARGFTLPRDTIDQEPSLETEIPYDNRRAEDLVFWPGHVGVLKTPDLLLHATAHSLRCCVEPLQDVIQRAGTPSSIKRMNHINS